jgi:predicted NUDIX family NTP pyrophosphohydrolase
MVGMAKTSAGLLPYRLAPAGLEVFLVHPGGPFWRNKDKGAWTIAKGEIEPGEDALEAARREFREETGQSIAGAFVALPDCRQAGGKIVRAWAVAAGPDASAIKSNSFELEWPPRSGRRQSFPEIDRARWFMLDEARQFINRGQMALLDALAGHLAPRDQPPSP